MAITAVARVVSALQWRLTLMGSSATTTSVSRRLYCMGLKPGRGSPPGWMILAGNHPPYRSAASRDTEARVRNRRFAMATRRAAMLAGRAFRRTRAWPVAARQLCREPQFSGFRPSHRGPIALTRAAIAIASAHRPTDDTLTFRLETVEPVFSKSTSFRVLVGANLSEQVVTTTGGLSPSPLPPPRTVRHLRHRVSRHVLSRDYQTHFAHPFRVSRRAFPQHF